MTVENWISQMGIGSKQLTERYAEYPGPAHDQHLYYSYEPSLPSHGNAGSTKYNHSGSGHKNSAAMSALTLLAFLFFLHILQQCLKEHMTSMSTPQVMVVSAGRETEQSLAKTSIKNKLDKTGVANDKIPVTDIQTNVKTDTLSDDDTPLFNDEKYLMKIQTAEHTPDKSYSGLISAMEKN